MLLSDFILCYLVSPHNIVKFSLIGQLSMVCVNCFMSRIKLGRTIIRCSPFSEDIVDDVHFRLLSVYMFGPELERLKNDDCLEFVYELLTEYHSRQNLASSNYYHFPHCLANLTFFLLHSHRILFYIKFFLVSI